ncbi:prepilin-type N-terminal cleavage/methylation domain-containing protein [Conchiformibius steedae DSM 2580]|uniref:Prepilin-type N-terminal cleavage/methylation domain-containing protein n=1 Tax=Conchiformibius steedae DSM 2580 TaxID=1121352 RepID=A0AAE9L035_9NEIS|nr:type IV pilin protein [Conchiformibius steedae]QMT34558.1 prepilin-type N-terminal cleavage/methylation domain-containing protein [Conchiformibius steedae]URD67510.1 prepilin-type N-terminal cleavage/methylation domain-containing protein [Conchiformibius steedae DSM 2580]
MRGFVLSELLVTLAIVAVLALAAYPGYEAYVRRARLYEAQQAMILNMRHLEQHYMQRFSFKKNRREWADLPVVQTKHFCIRMQGDPSSTKRYDDSYTMKAVAFDRQREPRVLVVSQDGRWRICGHSHSSCSDTGYFTNPNNQSGDSACIAQ